MPIFEEVLFFSPMYNIKTAKETCKSFLLFLLLLFFFNFLFILLLPELEEQRITQHYSLDSSVFLGGRAYAAINFVVCTGLLNYCLRCWWWCFKSVFQPRFLSAS